MAEVKFKVGDEVIVKGASYHQFNDSAIGEVIGVRELNGLCIIRSKDHHVRLKEGELAEQYIFNADLKLNKMTITKQQMKDAVEKVANDLMTRDGNITTLFLRDELRVQYPAVLWNQYKTGVVEGVSNLFHELVREGRFKSIKDNGTYQTYVPKDWEPAKVVSIALAIALKKASTKKPVSSKVAVTTPKLPTISRTKALDLIKNSGGQFITVEFITKGTGDLRLLNGQYSAKIQPTIGLGLITLRESSKAKLTPKDSLRQFSMDNLKKLKVKGQAYSIK